MRDGRRVLIGEPSTRCGWNGRCAPPGDPMTAALQIEREDAIAVYRLEGPMTLEQAVGPGTAAIALARHGGCQAADPGPRSELPSYPTALERYRIGERWAEAAGARHRRRRGHARRAHRSAEVCGRGRDRTAARARTCSIPRRRRAPGSRSSLSQPRRPAGRFSMKSSRLEAFSDGVITILITIMVLELKRRSAGLDVAAAACRRYSSPTC